MTVEVTRNNLRNPWWRLNHLYLITDKSGSVVRFKMNRVQEKLWNAMHYLNLILKARQEGCTTFVDLFMLDNSLWNPDVEAAVVADTKDNAMDIFRRKVKFPYEHLDKEILAMKQLVTRRVTELAFNNGSVISVGTGLRSATLNYLHISEMGGIAKKYPEKAKEIRSGAFETVGPGQFIFVESTGQGRDGVFYELCDKAQRLQQAKAVLTTMDFKFHFFPWFDCPDYTLDEPVPITRTMQDYFRKIKAETGVILSQAQKAWYIKKRAILGDDVEREYPSTPSEAFSSGIEGTYFKRQFIEMREQGRITSVPAQGGIAVDTWWDIGMDDHTSVWFTQDIGRELHIVDFYENSGEGLEFYRDELDRVGKERGYRYGQHMGPHDMKVRELGTGVSRLETARKLGLNMKVAPRVEKKADSIQQARSLLRICFFDQERCDSGLDHLELYRKEWDDIHGVWREKPLHNAASHAADAYQTLAIGHTFINPVTGTRAKGKARVVEAVSAKGWT